MFMQKFVGAFASFLPGILLNAAGYDAAVAATDSVKSAILSITGWLPAVVALLGLVFLILYPLNRKNHREMLEKLAKNGATP